MPFKREGVDERKKTREMVLEYEKKHEATSSLVNEPMQNRSVDREMLQGTQS